jgi:hypothetical protein
MKNIYIVLLLLAGLSANARQNAGNEIGQGTALDYTVFIPGQQILFQIIVDAISADNVSITWSMAIPETVKGRYRMDKRSLDSAAYWYWTEPRDGDDVLLPPDQTFVIISRAAWNELNSKNEMTYDGVKFIVKKDTANGIFTAGNLKLNCFYLESSTGGSKIWLLKNAAFPIVLKYEGNGKGADFQLADMRKGPAKK